MDYINMCGSGDAIAAMKHRAIDSIECLGWFAVLIIRMKPLYGYPSEGRVVIKQCERLAHCPEFVKIISRV